MWLLDEQLGAACSARPELAAALARAASGHWPTPASLPVSPGGRVRLILENSWVPSARLRLTTVGVARPAIGLTEPASICGAFGTPQSPFGPWEIVKGSWRSKGVAGWE